MTKSFTQRNLLVGLCLTIGILVVYWPVSHFEFANYDDPRYVTENQHLRSGLTLKTLEWVFTTPLDQWMPLTWLVRVLEYRWFDLNAGLHHSVNVALHIVNALLLFSVLNQMASARGGERSRRAATWRSGLVAALFALHPLHVESVAWVTGLKDVLSTFFWLLTIWAYIRYVEEFTVRSSQFSVNGTTLNAQHPTLSAPPSAVASAKAERSTLHGFYALTLLFFTLGLMSKPMVVTLPFVLLLLDWWPLGRTQPADSANRESMTTSPGQLLKEKLPFFGLAAASCAITLWAQRNAFSALERLPVGPRVANALVSYIRYMGKIFWPSGLAVFYPYEKWPPLVVVEAAAILLGVSTWVIWRARREPHFVVGWLWYLGTLVPVIGLVQVGAQSIADRYGYLPSIGLFIMVAWAVPDGAVADRSQKLVATAIAVALLVLCAALCRLQVQYWRNSETLFRHALEVTKDNWLAHNNLGMALWRTGRAQEAQGHYEQALRLKPDLAEAHNNLAATLAQLNRMPDAIEHWEQAVRIKPDYARAHYNLGVALQQTGNLPEAIVHWERALQVDPDLADAHNNLGIALQQTGRLPEAIDHYEQALRIKPDSADTHSNLGNIFLRVGRLPEAIGQYEAALRLKPGSAEAHNNLGSALMNLDRVPEAIDQYEQALRIQPDNAVAHFNLGVALEQTGRVPEAVTHYAQALRLNPNMAPAQQRLARLQGPQ